MNVEALTVPRPAAVSQSEVATMFAVEPWSTHYPPMLTIEQVARLLQVSRRTIHQWIAEGKFAGTTSKVGKHRRFLRERVVQNFFRNKDENTGEQHKRRDGLDRRSHQADSPRKEEEIHRNLSVRRADAQDLSENAESGARKAKGDGDGRIAGQWDI
jgi:excisionase family DNA binding protein